MEVLVVAACFGCLVLLGLIAAVAIRGFSRWRTIQTARELANPFTAVYTADAEYPATDCFPAGGFVCDFCGEFNFYAMIAIEREVYTQRELEYLSQRVSPDYVGKAIYLNPTHVSCSACHTIYRLRPANDETPAQ